MKKSLVLLIALFVSVSVVGQDKIKREELSAQGQSHYDKMRIYMTASMLNPETAVDVALGETQDMEKKIINELEAITWTDSNYAPVFYELGTRYGLLGKEVGEPYFSKAEQAFRRYGELKGISVSEHFAMINKLRDAYEKEKNYYLKYTGKWGFVQGGNWYIEIGYKEGRYTFSLNPYDDSYDDVVAERIDQAEIRYTIKKTVNHSEELRKKGWLYYEDDCDSNADSGYSSYGVYRYDKSVIYADILISLDGAAPEYSVRKIHNDFYYDGRLSYAETIVYDSNRVHVSQLVRN